MLQNETLMARALRWVVDKNNLTIPALKTIPGPLFRQLQGLSIDVAEDIGHGLAGLHIRRALADDHRHQLDRLYQRILTDLDGKTSVPGLYAAGEMVGGLFYFNYPAGTGLVSGSVFGKIAGTGAADAVPDAPAPSAAAAVT